MAGSYQARQQPNRGVPYVEEALRCHPEDESIARKLVLAYEKSGLVKKYPVEPRCDPLCRRLAI